MSYFLKHFCHSNRRTLLGSAGHRKAREEGFRKSMDTGGVLQSLP